MYSRNRHRVNQILEVSEITPKLQTDNILKNKKNCNSQKKSNEYSRTENAITEIKASINTFYSTGWKQMKRGLLYDRSVKNIQAKAGRAKRMENEQHMRYGENI